MCANRNNHLTNSLTSSLAFPFSALIYIYNHSLALCAYTKNQSNNMPKMPPKRAFQPTWIKYHPTRIRSVCISAKPLIEPIGNIFPPIAVAKAIIFQYAPFLAKFAA